MPRGCNRAVAHNRILEEPAMAKAKSLVGLDVHATKIVAAVLDADTGEIAFFAMTAEIEKAAHRPTTTTARRHAQRQNPTATRR